MYKTDAAFNASILVGTKLGTNTAETSFGNQATYDEQGQWNNFIANANAFFRDRIEATVETHENTNTIRNQFIAYLLCNFAGGNFGGDMETYQIVYRGVKGDVVSILGLQKEKGRKKLEDTDLTSSRVADLGVLSAYKASLAQSDGGIHEKSAIMRRAKVVWSNAADYKYAFVGGIKLPVKKGTTEGERPFDQNEVNSCLAINATLELAAATRGYMKKRITSEGYKGLCASVLQQLFRQIELGNGQPTRIAELLATHKRSRFAADEGLETVGKALLGDSFDATVLSAPSGRSSSTTSSGGSSQRAEINRLRKENRRLLSLAGGKGKGEGESDEDL